MPKPGSRPLKTAEQAKVQKQLYGPLYSPSESNQQYTQYPVLSKNTMDIKLWHQVIPRNITFLDKIVLNIT
jgi:hypothetical protein